MWPFTKRKGLIKSKYLSDSGIDSSFSDAFQRSKRKLRVAKTELQQQDKDYESQLGELHSSKKMMDNQIKRLTNEAEAPGKSRMAVNDLMVQLAELEKQYLQDSKKTRDFMAKLRQVRVTIWLLEKILDGTHNDPEALSNPPEEGWVGDWEDLFLSIPDAGHLDAEMRNELLERFDINEHRTVSEESVKNDDDDVDPLV